MTVSLRALATAITVLIAFMSVFHFIRFRSRRWLCRVVLKMLDNSLAPYLALVAAMTVLLGILIRAPMAILAGAVGTAVSTLPFSG